MSNTNYQFFNETVEYDVSVVSTTPSNSKEVKNNNVSFIIDLGTYVTNLELKLVDGAVTYVYTTTLNIEGKYVIGGAETKVKDSFTTSTTFKNITENFMPISSQKSSSSTSTVYENSGVFEVMNFTYNYSINYGDKNAETTYSINNLKQEGEPTVKTATYKKYAEKPFVDNDLIMLLPRAYKFKDTIYETFNTIDVISSKNTDMIMTSSGSNGNGLNLKKLNVNYLLNGESKGSNELEVCEISTFINDTYSGANFTGFYATDHQTHRHRLVEAYTALNLNMGYLKYTIKSATAS